MSSKQQAIEFFMDDVEYFDANGVLNQACISRFGVSLQDYVAGQRYSQIVRMNRSLKSNFKTLSASVDNILVDN